MAVTVTHNLDGPTINPGLGFTPINGYFDGKGADGQGAAFVGFYLRRPDEPGVADFHLIEEGRDVGPAALVQGF